MITLITPLGQLNRVGKTTSSRLKKLGLETAEDLLFHFPFRYDDFSKLVPISKLQIDETATIKGRIDLIANKRSPRKRIMITEAMITDDNDDSIKAIWFSQPFIAKTLEQGDEVYLAGKLEETKYGLQFTNPAYEKIKQDTAHTARLIPIYPTTEGITQKQIRFLLKTILPLSQNIDDFLPEKIKQELNLFDLQTALNQIHFPENNLSIKKASERLKFDELFLLQIKYCLTKKELEKSKAKKIKFNKTETKKFVDSLPFKLTDDQRKTGWEILQDLEKSKPMNRLLEGDVGSGKTIVACLAILNTFCVQLQTAYMAPTEILARQHFENICEFFKELSINIALFTRSEKLISQDKECKKISKLKLIQKIKNHPAVDGIDLVIGTHSLIQENIKFKDLALIIIDEQHRFGVKQRKKLQAKNKPVPHLLSMTATPIPRTLALTLYGDLDLSIIKEMPKGRKKITTKIVDPMNRDKAYQFIREKIDAGQQIFVVCPLIEESDLATSGTSKLEVKSVKQEFEKLDKSIFPEIPIAMLHGKLKSKEKEKIMKDFQNNKIKILVSTSVIEVGIDIPNATIMMIEGAERFGLAQLHQFRGRVGRGDQQSYCFLFTDSPSWKTKQRLAALEKCSSGFELAEKDLQLRGSGEIIGTRQSGMIELKIASLSDVDLIKISHEQAEKIIDEDPELKKYPDLRDRIKLNTNNVHLE